MNSTGRVALNSGRKDIECKFPAKDFIDNDDDDEDDGWLLSFFFRLSLSLFQFTCSVYVRGYMVMKNIYEKKRITRIQNKWKSMIKPRAVK